MDKTKYHDLLCQEIHKTYVRKNHDYGDSFSKSFDTYGIISAMVRMSDKWNRLEELTIKNGTARVNESIRDTLMDLANYALLTVMELDCRDIEADTNVPVRTCDSTSDKTESKTYEFTCSMADKPDIWSLIMSEGSK